MGGVVQTNMGDSRGSALLTYLLASGLLLTPIALQGCRGGARPYSAMHKAAESELSPVAQARDHRLKMELRTALVSDQGLTGLTLSPEVFMERGYVIGRVQTLDQADAVRRIAHGVPGLRSVDVYLPVAEPQSREESGIVSDLTIKAEIASALRLTPGVVATRITTTVLDGQAVLVGVVSGEEERRQAEKTAAGVTGVKKVTNWLLVPESGYGSVRPRLR
jgi:hyperosmotically inducible periplasmic protein